jgi:hypothetical protein
MIFNNEREFEQHIRELIDKHIVNHVEDLMLLRNKKAVDILLCRNGAKPALFFIEVKYHKDYRLGTGHGKGGGFQPEIILRSPSYFETNMRWILGDMQHDGKYWFVDNATIRGNLSGEKIDDKYNNIHNKVFREVPSLNETELVSAITEWLSK